MLPRLLSKQWLAQFQLNGKQQTTYPWQTRFQSKKQIEEGRRKLFKTEKWQGKDFLASSALNLLKSIGQCCSQAPRNKQSDLWVPSSIKHSVWKVQPCHSSRLCFRCPAADMPSPPGRQSDEHRSHPRFLSATSHPFDVATRQWVAHPFQSKKRTFLRLISIQNLVCTISAQIW